jgi:serpin B
MVASLFGISAAMAMVYAGARENTSVQMKSVLSYPKNDLVLHEGYKDMMNVLQANKIFTFEAANRLFVHKKTKLLEAYTTLLEKHYHALPETVDFGQSEKTRSIINTWVEKQTKDKMKNIIPEGSLDDVTCLVLVNALYFKGDWKNKFDQSGG